MDADCMGKCISSYHTLIATITLSSINIATLNIWWSS